ncbi:MAG: hypothetical protein V4628_17155 [Pseudomonadota bacterium]
MNKTTEERYEREADGVFCIDVAADRAEELFNNFDRNAPFIRRDLDQDLVEYLIESASELSPKPFLIRFSFSQSHDNETLERIQRSVTTFFLYMASREQQMLRRMLYRSGVFLLLGLVILLLSLFINRSPANERSVLEHLLAEGVNIAAWVSLWEALATFIVEWFPYSSQIRLFKKLSAARLVFR